MNGIAGSQAFHHRAYRRAVTSACRMPVLPAECLPCVPNACPACSTSAPHCGPPAHRRAAAAGPIVVFPCALLALLTTLHPLLSASMTAMQAPVDIVQLLLESIALNSTANIYTDKDGEWL